MKLTTILKELKSVSVSSLTKEQLEAIQNLKSQGWKFVGTQKISDRTGRTGRFAIIQNGEEIEKIDPDGNDWSGTMRAEDAANGWWVDPSGGVHSPNNPDDPDDFDDPAADYA